MLVDVISPVSLNGVLIPFGGEDTFSSGMLKCKAGAADSGEKWAEGELGYATAPCVMPNDILEKENPSQEYRHNEKTRQWFFVDTTQLLKENIRRQAQPQ